MDNITIDRIKSYFGEDYKVFEKDSEIKNIGMLFCLKIQNLKKRVAAEPIKKSGLGGFFNNVTSNIVEKVSGLINESYVVGLVDGSLRFILSNKDIAPCTLKESDLNMKSSFKDGQFKSIVTVNKLDVQLESFEISISNKNKGEVLLGSLRDVLKCFYKDYSLYHSFENLMDDFYEISVLKQLDFDSSDIFDYKCEKQFNSLLSIYEDKLIIHDNNYVLDFKKVVAYTLANGIHTFLLYEENRFMAYSVSSKSIKFSSNISNLVMTESEHNDNLFTIAYNFNKAEKFLIAGIIKDEEKSIKVILLDDELYMGPDIDKIQKSFLFIYNNHIYVVFENDGYDFVKVSNEIKDSVNKILMCLNKNFVENSPQIAVDIKDKSILQLQIKDASLKIGSVDYDYSKISKFNIVSEESCSKIDFIFEEQNISIVTAKSTAYEIWRRVENAQLSCKLKNMTLQGTYMYLNELRINEFLACTFGELIKANKILNLEESINDILEKVAESDKSVLRSGIESLKSKFFTSEDLQESLLKKVSAIELERKIITKLLDEWTLMYPHYFAQREINWIKTIFGDAVNREFLEKERWRIIANARRVIQQSQMSLSKYLYEIQYCTAKIPNAIPDEIKKIDTSKFRRLQTNNITEKMVTGANVALGTSIALATLDIVVRGVYFTNPITFTIATKMLVDSYAKDDIERKDIKNFGYQTLSWWEAMMSSIDIIIIETRQGFNSIIESSMNRDGQLLKKLTPEQRIETQKRLAKLLINESRKITNEKFIKVVPEYDVSVASIIEDINNICNNYTNKLNLFGKNLIY